MTLFVLKLSQFTALCAEKKICPLLTSLKWGYTSLSACPLYQPLFVRKVITELNPPPAFANDVSRQHNSCSVSLSSNFLFLCRLFVINVITFSIVALQNGTFINKKNTIHKMKALWGSFQHLFPVHFNYVYHFCL